MSENEPEGISREEIKREFQLERMILFSDAVFAVVITLMAIEIKLPDSVESINRESLPVVFHHLIPVITAYTISYVFIGTIWYQHLKLFSLLKSYDKGLVVRNLIVLFFVGLFPFGASVISRVRVASLIPFSIYMGIIFCCLVAQYALLQYILIARPQLRNHTPVHDELKSLHNRKIELLLFSFLGILVIISWVLIPNKDLKPMGMLWVAIFPLIFKFMRRKKGK